MKKPFTFEAAAEQLIAADSRHSVAFIDSGAGARR